MPIFLRYFYMRMLIEQRDAENQQAKGKNDEQSIKPNSVARPPIVKK